MYSLRAFLNNNVVSFLEKNINRRLFLRIKPMVILLGSPLVIRAQSARNKISTQKVQTMIHPHLDLRQTSGPIKSFYP